MKTEEIQKISDAEYFDLKALSATQIKRFDKGAYWFWKTSPFNPEREPDKETDALIFGKLCHTMLLEPTKVNEEYEVKEFGATRKTKKYETAKAETTKTIISQEEYDRAVKMITGIQGHQLASAILNGAVAEMPVTWTDKETGLPCKAKLDAVKRTKNGIVVIDYKTSSDIDGILNWPQKLQYPLQAEFYSRAVEAKYGEKPCEFVFIIQSNKEGEEDIVCVANVEYDTQAVAQCIVDEYMRQIAEKLRQWDKTHDKSIWAAYPHRCQMTYSNWYMERGE